MDTELTNERLSIKNLLFTKAIPNYVIPIPINNRKVYSCTDCGDRFLFQSSYDSHVNRKSVKINYMCRHCSQPKVFYNRCNLLLHIRSHAFKTATINVYDLQVEPLPLNLLCANRTANQPAANVFSTSSSKPTQQSDPQKNANICYECKAVIPSSCGPVYKDRGRHFMEYTNEVYTCPICLFALPTVCGLKAHIRLHLKEPPYFCPECGIHLPNKTIHYPYSHHCEGFKMMRATARLKCPISGCRLFHPNDYKEHMKQNHLKKVYKCPLCVVACFNAPTMQKHLKSHNTDSKGLIFYQCEQCPGRLVLQSHIENHLRTHANQLPVYPCWTCGSLLKTVTALINHHLKKHGPSHEMKNVLSSILTLSETTDDNNHQKTLDKTIYRVVKKCDQCKRSFTYNCKYDEIHILPNECPYKCSSNLQADVAKNNSETNTNSEITCHLCKARVNENWKDIKKHYATYHKSYKCLDGEIVIKKMDVMKHKLQVKKLNSTRRIIKGTIKKKIRGRKLRQSKVLKPISQCNLKPPVATTSNNASDHYSCNKCNQEYESKQLLEMHIISHRDPFMAYQCMECGLSFVVKPSFSTHLLLEHGITDVQSYINTKQCYNENALAKNLFENVNEEPLKENQCRICREQFDNLEDLEKHFRVHGMAFLMKSTTNKSGSP